MILAATKSQRLARARPASTPRTSLKGLVMKHPASVRSFRSKLSAVVGALALTATLAPASADAPHGFLETLYRQTTLTSTITPNGDLNPYAVIVAPVSSGTIRKGDVLVDNFNNQSNLQGTGTTIVDYDPVSKKTTTFATLPRQIPGCPGGVGLSTAMTMLTSGWVSSAARTARTARTERRARRPPAASSFSIRAASSRPRGRARTSTRRGATWRRSIAGRRRRSS